MADLDLPTLSQNVLQLGLMNEGQIHECLEEVGSRTADPTAFMRLVERKGYLTPWQSGKLLKGDLHGYHLGGFRLLYKIAAGSFGRVYRAVDPRSGEVVAVKVLRRRWSEDAHNIELFEREGRIGLSLRHPNIVSILAVDKDAKAKQYYIVMEFVEGGNLRNFLAIRKRLDAAEALRLLDDAVAGLAYAFERGITHQDIKLSNILISSQGAARMVDFGLFKFSRQGLQIEEDKSVDRTVDYAGLEKATGSAPGDPRSDIYFLGCVLFEMLSGRSPLVLSRNPRDRMRAKRFEDVKPLSKEEVKAPPSVFRLVETMMAFNPAHRFQNPFQLLDGVRDVRRGLDAAANPSNGPENVSQQTVFVVEKHDRSKNAIRAKFKELGYRVLLSTDPGHAVDRFRTNPFDGLIVNIGTAGEEGFSAYKIIHQEAERQGRDCAIILIFDPEQANWTSRVASHPNVAPLVRPVSLKQLYTKLTEMTGLAHVNSKD